MHYLHEKLPATQRNHTENRQSDTSTRRPGTVTHSRPSVAARRRRAATPTTTPVTEGPAVNTGTRTGASTTLNSTRTTRTDVTMRTTGQHPAVDGIHRHKGTHTTIISTMRKDTSTGHDHL